MNQGLGTNTDPEKRNMISLIPNSLPERTERTHAHCPLIKGGGVYFEQRRLHAGLATRQTGGDG
jgi:hypothetical protein